MGYAPPANRFSPCALCARAIGHGPQLDLRLVEAGTSIGGNHLWSFFGSDVARADRWLVAPLIAYAWPAYDVAFPAHRRTLTQPYYSISSERLDRAVRAAMPADALILGRKVLAASATAVVLANGDRIEATGVIDARGAGDLSLLDCAWQKFLGRELVLAEPHARPHPVVMDATVPQIDGYRFVYCLPFADDRMFVEDTYYSDSPALDVAALDVRIGAYARAQGWAVREEGRRETGVLPVTLGGDFDAYWRSSGAGIAKIGVRAGLFHPTTGYSLPDAIRSATTIADRTDFAGPTLHAATQAAASATWRARGFYRMLDTMLFRAAEPAERYRVLQRFYALAPQLIGRFYAGHSTLTDKARILLGKPPVPLSRAVSALTGARA